jgi:large subunit ribosomal protein L9
MIVILLKDVVGLGRTGEVVKVSDGYARNKLFPSGVAMKATDNNIRSLEKQKKIVEDKRQKEKNAAKELADRLSRLTVEIYSKSGEKGRLFGSITSKDIADAIKSQHRIDIDKRKIVMDIPIKNVGETQVEIKLYSDVVSNITVSIKPTEK